MSTVPQLVRSRAVQHLLGDHAACQELLRDLAALLDQQQAAPRWTPEHTATFGRLCGFFRQVVLSHIRREEEVLYKALEEFLPHDTGPLAVLRAEHREIIRSFERLCAMGRQLAAGEDDPHLFTELNTTGRYLIQTIHDHIYKEERIFFPMIARYFSDDRDAYLLEKMQALAATSAEAG